MVEKFTLKYNPLSPALFSYIGNEDTMGSMSKSP